MDGRADMIDSVASHGPCGWQTDDSRAFVNDSAALGVPCS